MIRHALALIRASSRIPGATPNHRRYLAVVELAVLLGLLSPLCGCRPGASESSNAGVSKDAIADAADSLQVLDLDGRIVQPFQTNDAKAVVFIFVRPDCPISNRYAPEIRRLHERFSSKDANFWLVYADPDVATEEIRRHRKEFQLACGALRDPRQVLVRLCRARVTPEAAVFDSGRRLVYHGRIDDRFVAFGNERPAPTRRDLEEVLAAVTERKPVTPTSTTAVGCTIAVPP